MQGVSGAVRPPLSAAVGFGLRTRRVQQAAAGTPALALGGGGCCLILGVWLVSSWTGVGFIFIIGHHVRTQMSATLPDTPPVELTPGDERPERASSFEASPGPPCARRQRDAWR